MSGLPGLPGRRPRSLTERAAAGSLAGRFAALPPRRQQRMADLGVGVALAAVNVVSLLPYAAQLRPLWVALALVAAQGILLCWRRAWPVPVLVVIGGARVAYDQMGFGYAPLPLGPAIAFYTVIDRCGPLLRWLSAAGVATGIAVSQAAPGHHEPYDAIFQVMIFLTAAAAGALRRAQRATMREAETRADRAEAELDREASRAAALERSRIARELHDVVAHHVSLMAVQAEAAASLLPDHPAEARRSAEIIGDTARLALTELRRLLGVLRRPSERAEMAPVASLGELGAVLDQVRGAGLAVDFDITGKPCPLAPGVELTAYRIIQEALTNTIRHAGATRAAVTLCYEPGFVTVRVTDPGPPPGRAPARRDANGRPGEPESPLAGTGFGLAGIAERVASCGGKLTVGPAGHGGFGVVARLPAR